MQRLIWAVVISCIMSLCLNRVVVPWLRKMKQGNKINELGPKSHQAKQGTPIMGGIIFMAGMVLVPLIFNFGGNWEYLAVSEFCILGFGTIGFVDDYIKIKLKRSEGLRPKQKILPQFILAVALSVWAYIRIGSSLTVPFAGIEWQLGWFYIPFMIFIIVGVVNSANLLDGCDGLLGGCGMIDYAFLGVVMVILSQDAAEAEKAGYYTLALVSCACAGALLGFLQVNTKPASVFMGDSGSFSIGGGIVAIALCTRLSLLLPIICFAMMSSALSDIIQIGYFKATHGKRIFKMAPLQHHFELSGMQETRIVHMYRTATIILCLIALLGYIG